MLALLLYPEPAASVGNLCPLAFGDSAARPRGDRVRGASGIPYTGGKTVAGSAACCAVVLAVTLRMTGDVAASLAVAVAAALLEAAPTRDYDNLMLPVGAGLVAHYVL